LGGLGIPSIVDYVWRVFAATGVMVGACSLIQKAPFFPTNPGKDTALIRVSILVACGAAVYFGICRLMKIGFKEESPDAI